MNFPDKKYQIIYADPAWHYNRHDTRGCPYPMLDVEEIINFKVNGKLVKEISDENCILFLWATFPKLPDALKVIEGWDFEYKTLGFNWIKQNKKNPNWFWGMGNWTRSNPEICLIGTKGKPKRLRADVHSVIVSSYREHSKKPDVIRERIIQLVGDLPRIELFSRTKVHGWDVIGNDEKLENIPLEAFSHQLINKELLLD